MSGPPASQTRDRSQRSAPSKGTIGILTAILEAHTGQKLGTNRAWRVETALTPLLRELGFDTLEALALAARRSPMVGGRVADALVNQETSFFRDAVMFETVANAVLALRSEWPERRPRVWSAGCSLGQEPLSLAMLFEERADEHGGPPPEIVATDVSDTALVRARSGRYSQFEIQRGLPVRRMIRWFDQDGRDWVAKPELVRRIAFRRLNLVVDAMPPGRFDVILCRNVLLYLTPAHRCQILDRFAGALRPGGLLVLGAGETVTGHTDAFCPSPRYRGLYEATASA